MLGRKHSSSTAGKKEVDRMLWNSPPVGSLQSSVPVSNGTGKQVRYRAHLPDDDEGPGSPVEVCDVAVLKITDATTTSVGPALSTISSDVTATSPAPTPPAAVDTAGSEDERRRRWLDMCQCERHLVPIKLFYFTFIGALGVVISFAVIFLKQVGLSALQIGIISGIRPILGFISAPAWGALADRYNIRRVLMLVSMFAWLVFYGGLYFIQAPARRDGLSGHDYVDSLQVTNATPAPTVTFATAYSTVTASPNGSTSGTTVDVRLHVTGQQSSTTVLKYVNNCSNF